MAILSMQEEKKIESDWADLDEVFGLQRESIDSDVAVIVLKIHEPAFGSDKRSFEYRICGKTMTEWVCMACAECPIFEIETTADRDLLDTIRPHLSDKKYTAVLYADTPLLERKTFLGILDYVKQKRMNVCKLDRGYIFVTEYLRTAERIYSSINANLDIKDDFLRVFDMDTFAHAQQVLKNRVLAFHLAHGVEILDMASTNIDADVMIAQNTVIYPNNTILGHSVIGENTLLFPSNTIINSQIGNNCKIYNSVIDRSKIRDNSSIEPFSFIQNGEIK